MLRPLYQLKLDKFICPKDIAFLADGFRFVELGCGQTRVWQPTILHTDSMNDNSNTYTTAVSVIPEETSSSTSNVVRAITCRRESNVIFWATEDGLVFACNISGSAPENQHLFVGAAYLKFLYFDDQGLILAYGNLDDGVTARKVSRTGQKRGLPVPRNRRGVGGWPTLD